MFYLTYSHHYILQKNIIFINSYYIKHKNVNLIMVIYSVLLLHFIFYYLITAKKLNIYYYYTKNYLLTLQKK